MIGLLLLLILSFPVLGTAFPMYTTAEITIWKDRAKNGPYRVAGDVSTNSPGDWTRILANANTFVSNPTAQRWTGWSGLNSCARDQLVKPGDQRHLTLRDAAFASVVCEAGIANCSSAGAYRTPIVSELLFHAALPELNFTNTALWCADGVWIEAPGIFDAAHWLTKLFTAYALIRNDVSAGDQTTLDAWFTGMMDHFRARINAGFEGGGATWPYYVSRLTGNWTLTSSGTNAFNARTTFEKEITHFGGHVISQGHQVYNNRKGIIVALYGLIGAQYENAQAINSFKAYVKEAIQFATFPDNTYYEFNRWVDTVPTLGFSYAANHMANLAYVIDQLARHGDTDLLDYSTTNGSGGGNGTTSTVGGPKSVKGIIDHLMLYTNGAIERYGTDQAARNGNPAYRIKLLDGVDGQQRVHDIYASMLNLFWQDSTIRSRYLRQASGTIAYPSTPGGGVNYWGGTVGMLPGMLFMFGQMEGRVDPYNLSTDTVKPNPPTNFTATMASSSSITLNCTAPTTKEDATPLTDLVGYRAQWCQNASCALTQTFDFPSCPHVHSGLQPNTLHRYQIAAVRAVGTISDYTTPVQEATTDVAPPVVARAHWTMDNVTGTTATESAGDASGPFHGTLYEGTTPATQGPQWVAGRVNGALLCDGVNDNVEIPHNAALDLTGSMVAAMWAQLVSAVNVSTSGNTAVILTKEGAAGATPFHLGVIDSTGPKFRWFQTTGGTTFTSYPIQVGEWHHITMQRNVTALTLELFVDGVRVQSVPYTGTVTASGTPIKLCASSDDSLTRYANVIIDDLKLFPDILSDTQIFNLAQEGVPSFVYFGLECSIGVGGTYTRIANCPSAFPICFYDDSQVSMGTPRTQALPLQPGLTGVSGIHVASPEDTTKTVGLAVSQQADIAYVLQFKPEISLSDVRCRPVHANGTPIDQVLTSPPAQVFTGENRLIGTIRGGRFK